MPSETTKTVGVSFTNFTTKSWSECGMYDDMTGWTVCNHCGAEVANEYNWIEEDEVEYHESGACAKHKDLREYVRKLSRAMTPVVRCRYCGGWDGVVKPCDCPF